MTRLRCRSRKQGDVFVEVYCDATESHGRLGAIRQRECQGVVLPRDGSLEAILSEWIE